MAASGAAAAAAAAPEAALGAAQTPAAQTMQQVGGGQCVYKQSAPLGEPPLRHPLHPAGSHGHLLPCRPPGPQEVAEEQVVMQQVCGDQDLAKLVHARSAGLQQLETLTGGSRVPAEALARAASGGSPRAGAA